MTTYLRRAWERLSLYLPVLLMGLLMGMAMRSSSTGAPLAWW